jgi:ADP-heptose:LPS heptosyltransferase
VGDSVLSTALINYLINKYPSSRISIVTSTFAQDIFKKMPQLDNLFIVDKKKFSFHWFKIWKLVIDHTWDLTIDLRSSYLSYLIRTKKNKIFRGNEHSHKVEQLKRFLNIDTRITPKVWIDENDKSKGKSLLKDNGPFIAVAPFSNWPQKDWSLKNYIDLFKNDFFKNYTLLFFGQSKNLKDQGLFDNLIKLNNIKIYNLFDQFNLREIAGIIDSCNLFIGSDSALMHISASTSCRTIGLFGPTNDLVYRPWGDGNIVIRAANSISKKERPDKHKDLGTESLLNGITVEEVFKRIKEEIA